MKHINIKNSLIQILYNIGKKIYRYTGLNQIEPFQRIAVTLVICMQTIAYKLCLTLNDFNLDMDHVNDKLWGHITDAKLTGGSRLITKEDRGFIPCLQNNSLWDHLKVFKLQEEALLKFKIQHTTKTVFLRPQADGKIIEGTCFSALSPFSASWVHWLFEVLPHIIRLSQRPDANTIKILVEDDAPAQIYQTITCFFAPDNIMKIKQDEQIICKNLIVSTDKNQSWSILWGRDINRKLTETYHHNLDSIMLVRNMVYKKFSITDLPPQENVFIRRKAQFRFIHNEQEIADYLLAKDYKVIEPSSMSFREQVECFSNTRVIAAQAGASLANIIFMKPKSTVICMAANSTFLNYEYFLSIAKALGISFHYVLGTVDDEHKYSHTLHLSIKHPLNASFTVEKTNLDKIIINL